MSQGMLDRDLFKLRAHRRRTSNIKCKGQKLRMRRSRITNTEVEKSHTCKSEPEPGMQKSNDLQLEGRKRSHKREEEPQI